jgi:16S rRNA (guanine966-N2)-methyltransferase
MRIIAGRFKGVRLKVPHGRAVRPTTDRVREALFSTLGSVVNGSRVLELFAGTGAFGLEALSRGADSAVFADSDRLVVASLAETVHRLGLVDRVTLLSTTATKALKKLAMAQDKFRIVYLDPPYASDWITRIVSDPLFLDVLEVQGHLIVERDVHAACPKVPAILETVFSRKYGGTMVEIFVRHATTGTNENCASLLLEETSGHHKSGNRGDG